MSDDVEGTRRKSLWSHGSSPARRDGAGADPFDGPGGEPLEPATAEELPYASHHAGVDGFDLAVFDGAPPAHNPFVSGVVPTFDLATVADVEPDAPAAPEPAGLLEADDLFGDPAPPPTGEVGSSPPPGQGGLEADDLFGDPAPPPSPAPAPELDVPVGFAVAVQEVPDEDEPDLSSLFGETAAPTPAGVAPTMRVALQLSDEQRRAVRDLIGLASAGDPALQSVISTMEITQDPELDKAQRAAYEQVVVPLMHAKGLMISNPVDFPLIVQAAYDHLLGLGPLAPLWRDPDITDIIASGPDMVIVDRNGLLHRTDVTFDGLPHLHEVGRRLSTKVDDRGVSRRNNIVTVQLDRARVQLIWAPVARSGGNIIIRKHRRNMSLDELLSRGALSAEMAALLSDAVLSRATLLVGGGTAAGKTTYLNVASGFIPDTERVIVIEDTSELELANSFVEYYLTKEKASADDTVVVGYPELLEASLRIRPDRIIVGEIRSADGAMAVLTAGSTGHDGTMSTIHADDPEMVLERFVEMVRFGTGAPDEVIRARVARMFNLLVHVDKHDGTGMRYVSDISAVRPDGSVNQLFRGEVEVVPQPDGAAPVGRSVFTRVEPLDPATRLAQRMVKSGIDTTAWERT